MDPLDPLNRVAAKIHIVLKTRQSSRSVFTEARVTLVELKEPEKSSLEIAHPLSRS